MKVYRRRSCRLPAPRSSRSWHSELYAALPARGCGCCTAGATAATAATTGSIVRPKRSFSCAHISHRVSDRHLAAAALPTSDSRAVRGRLRAHSGTLCLRLDARCRDSLQSAPRPVARLLIATESAATRRLGLGAPATERLRCRLSRIVRLLAVSRRLVYWMRQSINTRAVSASNRDAEKP